MQYVKVSNIVKETKDIPDGEVFTVYTDDNKWCFGIKINKEFSLSTPKDTNVSEEEVKKSMKQVLYAKENGWSRLQEEGIDDYGEKGRIYHCLYCHTEAINPEAPCSCRGKPKPKGLEDFIFPSDW